MSSCEAPTLFFPRSPAAAFDKLARGAAGFGLCAAVFAALLLTGCAVGVDGADELPPLGVTPGSAIVDAGSAAPVGPVLDAAPIVPPLPPSLSTPQESSVPLPPPREAGTSSRPTTSTGGRADAGATGSFGGGGARGGTTSGGASGTTTGCNPLRCTNECSLAGPLQCCTLLDTCGCTWAPGAYCL